MKGCDGPILYDVYGLYLLYKEVELALKLANLAAGVLLVIGIVDAICL
jgi:hypothetical protein